MPDYGARHAVPEHTGIRNNKAAGRRLADFQIEGGTVGHVGLGPVIRRSFKMALNYCQTYRGVASETAFDISLFTNERDVIVLDFPYRYQD